MPDNDRSFDYVNLVLGTIAGLGSIVFAFNSSLPLSSWILICFAACFLIFTPLIVRHSSSQLPQDDLLFLRRFILFLWVLTLFLLICLILAHYFWASIPTRLRVSTNQPPYTDFQVGQFKILPSWDVPPGINVNPAIAYDEWQRSEDEEKQQLTIAIVGIIEKQLDGPDGTDYIIRIYPASRFFSIKHRGPVIIFEYLLEGSLFIFFLVIIFITFFLPWINDRVQKFRSGIVRPEQGQAAEKRKSHYD